MNDAIAFSTLALIAGWWLFVAYHYNHHEAAVKRRVMAWAGLACGLSASFFGGYAVAHQDDSSDLAWISLLLLLVAFLLIRKRAR